jgi:hypothetical protein
MMTLVGNYEKVSYMEGFDVYIRGVGPACDLDETGRNVLFCKGIEKRFPSPQEIIDKLILLVFTYGDSIRLAEAQAQYFSKNARSIPKPYKKVDQYPAIMPAGAVRRSPTKKVLSMRRPVARN